MNIMQGQTAIHIWLLGMSGLLTNFPDHVPLEDKICRGTLLNQYNLNLCPDGISVM